MCPEGSSCPGCAGGGSGPGARVCSRDFAVLSDRRSPEALGFGLLKKQKITPSRAAFFVR